MAQVARHRGAVPEPICPSSTGRRPGTTAGDLIGVAAFSPRDVWTIGHDDGNYAVVQHWDGVHWQVAPDVQEAMTGLGGRSDHDIWIVDAGGGADQGQPLAEHWDGARWQVFSTSPHLPGGGNLVAVSVDTPRDVWAVGNTQPQVHGGMQIQGLVEHWDGTRWQEVPSPNPGRYGSDLYGVAALAPDDVWAVGMSINAPWRTLAEHWNGTRWRVVPSPNPSRYNNTLYGVVAVSSRDVWAVGGTQNPANAMHTIIEHWDGTRWRLVPSPSSGCAENTLYGVAALSSHDVWAVGEGRNADDSQEAALTEHWDGTHWRLVPNVNAGSTGSALAAVVASSTRDVWAVGNAGTNMSDMNSLGELTLVERWDGTRWRVVGT